MGTRLWKCVTRGKPVRFPDKPYSDLGEYARDYADRLLAAIRSVDAEQLKAAARLLENAYGNGRRVYVCGNGGSAAIAEHFSCDHLKGIATGTPLMPRVFSLASNVALSTAISNDLGYAEVFSYPLRSLAEKDDVVVVISSSGDSENVVRALMWARENGVKSIAFTGFDGGRARKLADLSLHIDAHNYGLVEDSHQALMHILAQYLRQGRLSGAVGNTKF